MAEVVDSIIAELIVRDNGYVAGFDKATAAHDRFVKSMPKVAAGLDLSGAEAQKYANRHKKAANDIAGASEESAKRVSKAAKTKSAAEIAASAEIKTAAKATADAQRVAAKAASDALKAAEREKQAALKATQREQEKAAAAALRAAEAEKAAAAAAAAAAEKEMATRARLAAVAERAVVSRGIPQSTSSRIGARFTPEPSGQSSIPASVMAGAATEEAAVEAEINHLMADRFDLAAKAKVAEGAVKRELQDQVEWIRRINAYKAAGLTEEQAILRAESETLAIERLRSEQAAKSSLSNAARFAEGAGIGRTGGNLPALAGIAVAAGLALGAEAIAKATEYARALQDVAKEAGLTTTALQVYQHAAAQDGVSQEQLSAGLRLFSENLGKARTGSEEQIKVFRALGIDITTAATAGELLPTLVNRISSIPDQAKRARVELALFGESGAKLDGLLSGGNERLDNLSNSLQKANIILSAVDIAKLDEVSKKLAEAKAQLTTDISSIVAHNASAILTLVNVFEKVAGAITTAANALARFNRYAAIGAKAQLGLPVDQDVKNLRLDNQEDHISGLQTSLGLDSKFTAPQAGGVNTKLLNSLGSPKGPKGKSASQIEAERLERDRKFIADEEREQQARLGYLSELTSDTRDQDIFARQRIEIERVARDREIRDEAAKTIASQKLKGAAAAEANARAETLVNLNDKNAALQLDLINHKEASRFLEEELAHQQTVAGTQTDLLNVQLALATTAKERRDIELRLLAIAAEQERLALQKLVDDKATTPEARTDAQTRLSALPGKTAGQAAEINQRDAGPWQQYLQSLPHTADQIEEAFQHAAVNGVENLNSSLAKSLSTLLGLHGAAGQFLEDLIQIGIQAAESALFGGGSSSGSSSGGSSSGLGSFLGAIAGAIGGTRASGGPVTGGKSYLVGEHGPEIVHMGGNGNVYPNGQLPNLTGGSGGGTVIHQSFVLDARYGITTPELLQHVNTVASQRAAEAGQASYRASVSAVPGTVAKFKNEKG